METKTVVIKDIELNWVNVWTARNPFGQMIWDLQVVADKDQAEVLEKAGVSVKERDGKLVANVKRKAVNAKGEPNNPPIVKGVEPNTVIPNGSKGNIKLFSYTYNVAGKSGRAAQLLGVNVTELGESNYNSNEDF